MTDARRFRRAAVGVVAAGVAASGDVAVGRDALMMGLDVLRDPLTASDHLRQELRTALQRAYPHSYADSEAIADRLTGLSEESLIGLMNGVQGAMFELRVAEMFEQGQLQLPEGAEGWELAEFTTAGVDGRFLDGGGNVVGVFQIKASTEADLITDHLARYPDVETVIATSEAAKTADGIDGVVDSGVSVHEVIPADADAFVDQFATSVLEGASEVLDDLPLLTFGVIAAELAARRLRGRDMAVALAGARERAGRALTWSALGSAAALLTGLQPTRLVVTVGGRTAAGWVARAQRDQQYTIRRLEQLNRRLSEFVTSPVAPT